MVLPVMQAAPLMIQPESIESWMWPGVSDAMMTTGPLMDVPLMCGS